MHIGIYTYLVKSFIIVTSNRESPPESPAQFETQIKPQVYVSRSTRSIMYKKLHFVSRNWRKKIISVACGISPIKIHPSDYPKTLISRKNRGSYMSAHVLLNLLNKLGKRDQMRGLPSILSLFRNEFNNSIIQEHEC